MYKIISYSSIGNLKLYSSQSEIGVLLGKAYLKKSPFNETLILASYQTEVKIEFTALGAIFIGIGINLLPVLENYSFANRSFNDIVNFFKNFGDRVLLMKVLLFPKT
jgi:hypothetical protein